MAEPTEADGTRTALDPRPALSVILPCYGEAALAIESVARLRVLLDQTTMRGDWEIIVVDDGGGDFPGAGWKSETGVQLISFPENRGKGAAVVAGMLAAKGRARVFTDVDLPYDPMLIPVIGSYLLEGHFHLILGDRNLPESSYRTKIGPLRSVLSGAATFLIGTLVTGGVFDTQCGIKGIRGDVADLLLPLIRTERFAFDVEFVYLALRFNCDIKRIPVQLLESGSPSTVRPLIDSARAIRDLFGIKSRAVRGRYESPALRQLIQAPLARRRAEIDRSEEPLLQENERRGR